MENAHNTSPSVAGLAPRRFQIIPSESEASRSLAMISQEYQLKPTVALVKKNTADFTLVTLLRGVGPPMESPEFPEYEMEFPLHSLSS